MCARAGCGALPGRVDAARVRVVRDVRGRTPTATLRDPFGVGEGRAWDAMSVG
jgi:hypothetical protein